MSIVIVPDYLRDAINRKIDTAFKEITEAEHDLLYRTMLEYFNEYGKVPEINVTWKQQ